MALSKKLTDVLSGGDKNQIENWLVSKGAKANDFKHLLDGKGHDVAKELAKWAKGLKKK